MLNSIVKGIVLKNKSLNMLLEKALINKTALEYIKQTIIISLFVSLTYLIMIFLLFKNNNSILFFGVATFFPMFILSYFFFKSIVNVSIGKVAREQENDILFTLEYFLINIESGNPIGVAIENISNLNRPISRFFKKINYEIKTGKDVKSALDYGIEIAASPILRTFLKKLRDSLEIGTNLTKVIENYIADSTSKKFVSIKSYSKKINPLITMYLILGIVVPSLGITFFIVAAAILEITPGLLKWLLVGIFLTMFVVQYIFYTLFKFQKETI